MLDLESFGNLPPVKIQKLIGFDDDGYPQISEDMTKRGYSGKSVVALSAKDIGSDVATLQLDRTGGCLILGLIQQPLSVACIDQETLVLEAEREIILRCGKSSITLTADGRVSVQGKQLLSRADGQNRVQGASVQLN